jgi:hypothetical protein
VADGRVTGALVAGLAGASLVVGGVLIAGCAAAALTLVGGIVARNHLPALSTTSWPVTSPGFGVSDVGVERQAGVGDLQAVASGDGPQAGHAGAIDPP